MPSGSAAAVGTPRSSGLPGFSSQNPQELSPAPDFLNSPSRIQPELLPAPNGLNSPFRTRRNTAQLRISLISPFFQNPQELFPAPDFLDFLFQNPQELRPAPDVLDFFFQPAGAPPTSRLRVSEYANFKNPRSSTPCARFWRRDAYHFGEALRRLLISNEKNREAQGKTSIGFLQRFCLSPGD